MASFDENGKYIKTNWKAGDKITSTKLNKIEESIEAVNDNDISRHVEADARLDALEAKDVAHDKELTKIKNDIADNKAASELGDYDINSRMTFLENELNEGIEEVHNVAETVDGKIAKAESDMTNAVNTAKEDMRIQVGNAMNVMDTAKEEMNTQVTNAMNVMDTAKKEMTTQVNMAKTEMNTQVNNAKTEMNTQINKAKSSMTTQVTTAKNEMTAQVNTAKAEMTTQVNAAQATMTDQVNTAQANMNDQVNLAKDEMNTQVVNATNVMYTAKKEMTTQVNNAKSDMEAIIANSKSEMNVLYNEIKDMNIPLVVDNVSGMVDTAKQYINTSTKTIWKYDSTTGMWTDTGVNYGNDESDDSILPTYWTVRLDEIGQKIDKLQKENGMDTLQFLWCSDIHGIPGTSPSNTSNIGNIGRYMMDKHNIPFFVVSGDIMSQSSHSSTANIWAEYNKLTSMLAPIKNDELLAVRGNHDGVWGAPTEYNGQANQYYHSYIGNKELFNAFMRRQTLDSYRRVFGKDGMYFYVDYHGYRIYMLNTHTSGDDSVNASGQAVYNCFKHFVLGSEQTQWVADTLNTVRDGQNVIFIAHTQLQQVIDYKVFADVVNGYIARRKGSASANVTGTWWGTDAKYAKVEVNFDFTNAKGSILGWFNGHIHTDYIKPDLFSNIPIFTITCAGGDVRDTYYTNGTLIRKSKTALETAIDIVTITSDYVYFTRIGSGYDRKYNRLTKEVTIDYDSAYEIPPLPPLPTGEITSEITWKENTRLSSADGSYKDASGICASTDIATRKNDVIKIYGATAWTSYPYVIAMSEGAQASFINIADTASHNTNFFKIERDENNILTVTVLREEITSIRVCGNGIIPVNMRISRNMELDINEQPAQTIVYPQGSELFMNQRYSASENRFVPVNTMYALAIPVKANTSYEISISTPNADFSLTNATLYCVDSNKQNGQTVNGKSSICLMTTNTTISTDNTDVTVKLDTYPTTAYIIVSVPLNNSEHVSEHSIAHHNISIVELGEVVALPEGVENLMETCEVIVGSRYSHTGGGLVADGDAQGMFTIFIPIEVVNTKDIHTLTLRNLPIPLLTASGSVIYGLDADKSNSVFIGGSVIISMDGVTETADRRGGTIKFASPVTVKYIVLSLRVTQGSPATSNTISDIIITLDENGVEQVAPSSAPSNLTNSITWQADKRLSSSTGNYSTQAGCYASSDIPCGVGDTVRIYDASPWTQYGYVCAYDDAKFLYCIDAGSSALSCNYMTVSVDSNKTLTIDILHDSVKRLRVCNKAIVPDNVRISVNLEL